MSRESCDEEEDSSFYFESDHLALRGNSDFAKVLRTIAILEAQRMRVHQQLEELQINKKRYLDDPQLLLQKLRDKEEIIAPNYMTIEKIPEVSASNTFENLPPDIKIKVEPGVSAETKVSIVRGRIADETKPQTYNQLWSYEEQRRLEELLIEYPAEEKESRRYAKIAKSLGNRTLQQVSSRVQKYFQKLHDAGLPIPGRKPKNRRSGNQTKTKHIYRPSTFFPAQNVRVQMPDDSDVFMNGIHSNMNSPAPASESTAPGTFNSVNTNFDYMETETEIPPDEHRRMLQLLNLLRDEKRKTQDGYNPDPMAAKCELCRVASVSQMRWNCNTCYCYLNQCTDCMINQLLTHRFVHITHDVTVTENDQI